MYCSIMEVVYQHVTPKDDKTASTAPVNATYSYKIRIKGIDAVLVPDNVLYAHICRCESAYTHNNKDGRNDKDRRNDKDAHRKTS